MKTCFLRVMARASRMESVTLPAFSLPACSAPPSGAVSSNGAASFSAAPCSASHAAVASAWRASSAQGVSLHVTHALKLWQRPMNVSVAGDPPLRTYQRT